MVGRRLSFVLVMLILTGTAIGCGWGGKPEEAKNARRAEAAAVAEPGQIEDKEMERASSAYDQGREGSAPTSGEAGAGIVPADPGSGGIPGTHTMVESEAGSPELERSPDHLETVRGDDGSAEGKRGVAAGPAHQAPSSPGDGSQILPIGEPTLSAGAEGAVAANPGEDPVYNRIRSPEEPATAPEAGDQMAPGAPSPESVQLTTGDAASSAPAFYVPDPTKLGAPGDDGKADSSADAVTVTGKQDPSSRYAGSSPPAGRNSNEAPSSLPSLRMEVSSSPIRVGASVSIRVFIDNAREIRSAPFHLVYPTHLLEFEGSAAGGFLASPDAELIFMAGGPPGRVMVALSLLGGTEGASGAGELCTLNFRALASGRAVLALEDLHIFLADRTILTPLHVPMEIEIQ